MRKLSITFASLSLTAATAMLSLPITFADSNDTTADTSGTSGTQPPSQSQPQSKLTDYAPISTVRVSKTGPTDLTFAAEEAKRNTPLVGSNAWHGFYLQSARDITIQLPMDRAISSVSIDMYQKPQWGVFYPTNVDFEAYVQGQWYSLGRAQAAIPSWDKHITTQTFSVDAQNVKTHLLRIHFPVGGWVFARQIHVWGNNFSNTGPQQLPALPQAPAPFVKPLQVDDGRDRGIHNMLLVYTGTHADEGTWSAQDFLPMTGYVDRNGQVTDRMFDTMLMLPYGDVPDTQAGWQGYLDDLFTPGQQLSALDAVVEQTNTALMPSDQAALTYKEKVVIGIPHPGFGDGSWGNVNGQDLNFSATSADPTAIQSRMTAMNWYVQTLLQKWKDAKFQNLQLVGLYWMPEQLKYTSPAEADLIQSAVGAAHQAGLSLFWIPYYDAAGIGEWQDLGFDAAWIQPMYVTKGRQADPRRLMNTEQLATADGLGIEVEMPWQVLGDAYYQALYNKTLTQLERDGMGKNVSHAFYMGSKVLVTSAESDLPSQRVVYENTYRFVSLH